MPAAESPAASPADADEREPRSLTDSVGDIQEETRILLPGVQTLFGFQLIAVFNDRFQQGLSLTEQRAHLVAMTLVVVAMGLLMTPATYHRRAEPDSVSRRFVRLSTRMLAWSSYPLMLGICLDFYLVTTLVATAAVSVVLAVGLLCLLALLWMVLPRVRAMQDVLGR